MVQVKTDEIKALGDAVKELNEGYEDLLQTMAETTKQVKATKQLWKKGNNPILIKLGLALIAFPDPTISDILGAALVAAGAVQVGIRHRAIYVENIYKSFKDMLKQMKTMKDNL